MIKKLFLFIFISLFISGCAKTANAVNPVETIADIHIESPIIVTSFGQSIDYLILEGILNNLKIEYTMAPKANINDLVDCKTLITVVGSSKKGLKFAEVTIEDELKRIDNIKNEPSLNSLNVVLIHMGGKNRRGNESDQLIEKSLEIADAIVTTSDGNFDNIFSDYGENNNINYKNVTNVQGLQDFLKILKDGGI